ncbi:hypothetical protein INT47_009218 [Mucor saturninus]|uniref:Arrestin C-terminal-like domain-containing protein n=1 Tax=Mucor saturninus TaxID=64648 RepID=A0A8H7RM78_9FUNG|nr:hypothetical protein INT47_009218 [Mucor saturninus]
MWTRQKNSKHILIELLEPVIFIDETHETSPVVRGTVIINLDNCVIQNLSIQFDGLKKTQWKKDSKVQQLVSKDLQIPATTGTTKFPFEMPLPSGIPESVKSSDIQVEYTMSVRLLYKKMNIPTVQHEESTKAIVLARLPERQYHPLATQKQFADWCKYRISIDKKSVALGSKLGIKFEISPLLQGFRLKQIFVQVLERRTVHDDTNQSCHFIYPAKNSHLNLPSKSINQGWQATCDYQLPDDKLSHSTMEYQDFKISHVVLVSLIVSDRHTTRTISYQMDVDLLNSQVSQLDDRDYLKLPAYNCVMTPQELQKLHSLGLYTCPPSYEDSIAV